MKPVPRIGGVAILLGVLVGVVAALSYSWVNDAFPEREALTQLLALLAGASAITLVGLVDDVRGVSSKVKALSLAGSALVSYGSASWWIEPWQPAGGIDAIKWIDAGFFMLWVVVVAVAINFIDGLDGLAGGLVLLATVVLAVPVLSAGAFVPGLVAASLMGALAGFLVFNRHPASVFMGDSGSMLIGVLIASLMLISRQSVGTMQAMVLPSLALSVPLMDGAYTFFRRHFELGRSVFSAERGHIHHRLLDCGFSHPQAVSILYGVSLAAVLIGTASLFFSGWSATACLSMLLPLLWGTFRFAGSLQATRMLRAIRSRRQLASCSKSNRSKFEDLQLELDAARTFGDWWSILKVAGDELDFADMQLTIRIADAVHRWDWVNPKPSVQRLRQFEFILPVPDSPLREGHATARIRVAITDSQQVAMERICLFSRLTDQYDLTVVRRKEKRSLSQAASLPKPIQAAHFREGGEQFLTKLSGSIDEGQFAGRKVALVLESTRQPRVCEAATREFLKLFPQADLFSITDPADFSQQSYMREYVVRTSFLQYLPLGSWLGPIQAFFLPLACASFDLSGYDLIISISRGVAQGVSVRPSQLHVCYFTDSKDRRPGWHRLISDENEAFGPAWFSWATAWLKRRIRNWQILSVSGVDHFIVSSVNAAREVERLFGEKSERISAPGGLSADDIDADDGSLGKSLGKYAALGEADVKRRFQVPATGQFSHCIQKRLLEWLDALEEERCADLRTAANVVPIGQGSGLR
ncbi:MAG: hypothetical protein NXI32_20200 [bacterium]|nr:hypothetical protein [bacterium]